MHKIDIISEYNNEIPSEIKFLFHTAPKDDIDWALVMYLFKHSNEHYSNFIFDEKNIITVGKVASWFSLNYDDVYNRLHRMLWWVSIGTVYGYHKPVRVCNITRMGIDSIFKIMEI